MSHCPLVIFHKGIEELLFILWTEHFCHAVNDTEIRKQSAFFIIIYGMEIGVFIDKLTGCRLELSAAPQRQIPVHPNEIFIAVFIFEFIDFQDHRVIGIGVSDPEEEGAHPCSRTVFDHIFPLFNTDETAHEVMILGEADIFHFSAVDGGQLVERDGVDDIRCIAVDNAAEADDRRTRRCEAG